MRSPYPKNEVFLFWTVRTTVVRTQVVLQLPCYDRRIFIDTRCEAAPAEFFFYRVLYRAYNRLLSETVRDRPMLTTDH